jgi:hypothetical protein
MREQASDAIADVTLHLAMVRRYFGEVLKPGSDPRLVDEPFAPASSCTGQGST